MAQRPDKATRVELYNAVKQLVFSMINDYKSTT